MNKLLLLCKAILSVWARFTVPEAPPVCKQQLHNLYRWLQSTIGHETLVQLWLFVIFGYAEVKQHDSSLLYITNSWQFAFSFYLLHKILVLCCSKSSVAATETSLWGGKRIRGERIVQVSIHEWWPLSQIQRYFLQMKNRSAFNTVSVLHSQQFQFQI